MTLVTHELFQPLWTLRKGDGEVHATLRNHGLNGWEVQLTLDGEKWNGQRYATRDEALDEAETYRVGLEAKGWTGANVEAPKAE